MNKSDLDKLDSILSASEPLTIPTYYLKKPYSLTNISIPLLSLFNLGEENFNIYDDTDMLPKKTVLFNEYLHSFALLIQLGWRKL